jgi:hypothetical protein
VRPCGRARADAFLATPVAKCGIAQGAGSAASSAAVRARTPWRQKKKTNCGIASAGHHAKSKKLRIELELVQVQFQN